ncbi:MAG: VanW family protein [Candidatus Woesebacteria bacterium]|nr:MAG: VanW family protein [Candidatus Woesebacteria bacterium]
MAKDKLIYKRVLVFVFGILLFLILGFFLFFSKRAYPLVYINDIYIGGRSFGEAKSLISEKINFPSEIVFNKDSQSFKLNTSDISLNYDLDKTLWNAFYNGRGALFSEKHFKFEYNYNSDSLKSFISKNISPQFNKPSTSPSVSFSNGDIIIDKGTAGAEVDINSLIDLTDKYLANPISSNKIEISIRVDDPSITEDEAQVLKSRALGILKKSLKLVSGDQEFDFPGKKLVSLLTFGSYSDKNLSDFVSSIESSIDQEAHEATFIFANGKVTEFSPPINGIYVNRNELIKKLKDSLKILETSDKDNIEVLVPISTIEPKSKISDTNDLGITELIGSGKSRFLHSIASRVHNIVLATSRINGLLIKPGEIFSFNEELGNVSKFTGYQEAYIIENGKTILGDGGGVCQVSTTLFRAALNTGLPIISRTAHAYRVGYYEQDSAPGLDATVYSPSPDLKIKNDTRNYILIQARADLYTYTLYFDLYGTSDGRKAIISKPVITEQKPPLPDEYTDDPTLPTGQVKQVDFQAPGAKVKFDYTVIRDGQTIFAKTFNSEYESWSNKFLRGVKT